MAAFVAVGGERGWFLREGRGAGWEGCYWEPVGVLVGGLELGGRGGAEECWLTRGSWGRFGGGQHVLVGESGLITPELSPTKELESLESFSRRLWWRWRRNWSSAEEERVIRARSGVRLRFRLGSSCRRVS